MANYIDSSVDLDEWYLPEEEQDKILMPSWLTKDVLERFSTQEVGVYGTALPWEKTRDRWALRPGELTIWAGINGHGKSLVTGQVALDLVSKGEGVCIASMEMRPSTTLYRMTRQALGQENYTREKATAVHEATDLLLWFYDHRGTVSWQTMIGLGRYVAKKFKVQHLFIDSLMKLGIATDDYNAQKQAVNELCALAHDTGLHIHLIHHARKSGGEDHPLDKFSIKGAGEIVDLADNGVLVWRNKAKERENEQQFPDPDVMKKADVVLDLCKQRDGEWEGRVGLYYHPKSMQFLNEPGPPVNYLERLRRLEAA